MEPKNYIVEKIDGEYAELRDDLGGDIFIALALLPRDIDVGTRLHFDNLEYTVI